ncbi:unnamed protein product, partial [Eruca vesicaria subsp. sativa]|nr:unnamed protein product [Eruca vesicaria subsp. sativa]
MSTPRGRFTSAKKGKGVRSTLSPSGKPPPDLVLRRSVVCACRDGGGRCSNDDVGMSELEYSEESSAEMDETERSSVNADEAEGSPMGGPENDDGAEDDITRSSGGGDEVDQSPMIADGLVAGGEVERDAIRDGEAGRSSTGCMLLIPILSIIPSDFGRVLRELLRLTRVTGAISTGVGFVGSVTEFCEGDENFDPAAALEAENEKAGGSLGKGVDPPVGDVTVDEVLDRDADTPPKKKKKKHKSSKKAKVDSTEVETAWAEVCDEDPSDGPLGEDHENLIGEKLTGIDEAEPPSVRRKRPIDDRPSDSMEKGLQEVDERSAPPKE